MEKVFDGFGIISGAPLSMANNKRDNENTSQSPGGNFNPILVPINRHFNLDFITLYKKTMAELKMTAIIANILGWPLYVFSVYENIENIKSVVLLVLGAIFVCVKIWQAYQKGRATKIANDRQQFELDCERWDKEDERRRLREITNQQ